MATPLTQPIEVPRCGRHGLREVGADQYDHVGLLDIRQRERQAAVDSERLVPSRRSRRHAPAAVVVDLRSPERNPSELA